MTNDENTPQNDPYDSEYLKYRVISQTGRSYLCNSVEWGENNNRVLRKAYEASANYTVNENLCPVDILIDGGIDVIPLQKWILPAWYTTPDKPL